MPTNVEAAERFVEYGLNEKTKGNRESASGPGSSVRNALDVGGLLRDSVREKSVRSILDLGCGDWNWMQHLMSQREFADVSYEGWEAHDVLVQRLNADHGSGSRLFKKRDIFSNPIPKTDLVICRDVLFHVDIALAVELVRKIEQSGSRYFLSTSFSDLERNTNIEQYLDIEGWGFYRINLEIEPFGLSEKLLEKVEERYCAHGGHRRYACLFEMA